MSRRASPEVSTLITEEIETIIDRTMGYALAYSHAHKCPGSTLSARARGVGYIGQVSHTVRQLSTHHARQLISSALSLSWRIYSAMRPNGFELPKVDRQHQWVGCMGSMCGVPSRIHNSTCSIGFAICVTSASRSSCLGAVIRKQRCFNCSL